MNETLVVFSRALIAFFSLLIFARILGKQQVSQLTFFDYILGITIGSIAGSLTIDLANSTWAHWVGLAVWALFVLIFQWLTIKRRKLEKYIDGEPTIVIQKGKLLEDNMKKMRYRLTDLLVQLRQNGVFEMTEVDYAVLETDGKLSILKKPEYQPVTLKDLRLKPSYKGMSTELIYDGEVMEKNLQQLRLNYAWLEKQINDFGFQHPKEVFLAVINEAGTIFIDGYQDKLQQPKDISDYKDLEW
ncbi:DUF421 domain-containing protein [Virgibacillus sp. MG-45]|uniref:DUF421 domain-containing protein n=1 Tax=Virgibacillus sp. MG-45 TaxID=3102791 RepID=UPI002ED8CA72